MLRQLPNAITLLRIVLVLPLGWAIVARRDDLALGLALLAGVSDALDGFLARRFGWFTRLGAWLDPAADKLMLVVAYLSLAWIAAVPCWLAALVVLRDVVIVSGALLYRRLRGALEVAPSLLSKVNTAVQIVYVLLVLLHLQGLLPISPASVAWLVAALTLASGLDYVLRFSRKAIEDRWA